MMRNEKNRYRSVFKVPPTEWCSIVSKRSRPNALVKAFLDIVRERFPKNIQQCPIDGKVEALNVKIRNKMLSIFPPGIYKFSARAYDDEDDNILTIAVTVKAEN
jgi:hypothetical protein